MRAHEAVRWGLAIAFAVMWIGGVLVKTPPVWAPPLFLCLAAALVVVSTPEPRTVLVYAVGGFVAELIGVHTGLPFGRYSYSTALGGQLWGVPLAISFAWVTLLAWSREVGRGDPWIGASAMTAADLLIDPVATRWLDYWRWEQAGGWFGVPWINFAGWFVVSWLLLRVTGRTPFRSRWILVSGSATIVFFAAMALVRTKG